MDTIAVVDFGGQYAHLIANRIRRLGVFSEVLLPETATPEKLKTYRGIILSGGPASVLAKDAPTIDRAIFDLNIPILAICYGHQLAMQLLGGKVKKGVKPEYGPATLKVISANPLFAGLAKKSTAWMSHWDEVTELPKGFQIVASTPDCKFAAVARVTDKKSKQAPLVSLQFHPEVTHTEIGEKLLANFVKLTGAKKSWTIDAFLKTKTAELKKQVGDRRVFFLVSGGVDSTVAFALLEKALGKDRVYGLTVDHGLTRKDEVAWVVASLKKAGFDNLHVAYESGHFLAALKNVIDPEEKRRIIGRVFLHVQRSALRRMKFNPRQWILGQGTIYPDTIESGGTKNAATIKTHHNRVPEIEEMLKQGLVVEPLAELYKDEVRELGRKLKLPKELVDRHPFPGPGLGVRVLCADELAKPDTTSRTEAEIRRKWKVDGKVLPIRSVGVQGDARTYAYAVAIFTASRDYKKLDRIATEIIQKFPEINRVVLAINTNKAPRMFRVKKSRMTVERIALAAEADALAMDILRKKKCYDRVWQMPVVLAPISSNSEKESVILRPVESTEAMTAAWAKLPLAVVNEMGKRIAAIAGVDYVLYDITNKPPATIEWE